MNAASFQVALTGLIDGHNAEDVAHRLAQMFKQSPGKMLEILDGKRRVLKKGLSEADARKYEVALTGAGCTCTVSAEAVAAPPAPEAATAAEPPSPLPPAPAVVESTGRNFYTNTATPSAAGPSAAVSTSADDFRQQQAKLALYQMGTGQTLVIISILLNGLCLGLGQQFTPLPAFIASVAVLGVMISGLISLSRGLGYSYFKRVGLIVLMLIPLVGLITLLVLNRKTSKALKAEGIRVGLAGASSDDLAALAVEAGLPAGTRPRAGMAFVAVLLVFGICFAVSSHYREKAEKEMALAMSQPCELTGVWTIRSRLGEFTLTLDENGKMQSSEPKSGDWRFERGELLLTENSSTTHYRIGRVVDGYLLERMGIRHDMTRQRTLIGKRCKA
jgi:hypothetical protein